MKYAFQYAYDRGIHNSFISSSNVVIVEDTLAISKDEALRLYEQHKEDFIYRLKKNMRPEMAIWEDVGDGEFPVYHKGLLELCWRDDLEVINGEFYKTKVEKTKIEI